MLFCCFLSMLEIPLPNCVSIVSMCLFFAISGRLVPASRFSLVVRPRLVPLRLYWLPESCPVFPLFLWGHMMGFYLHFVGGLWGY